MTDNNLQELIDIFDSKLDFTNSFPFLNDSDTIEFIKSSKVMFINRGLPGSGKTTLTKKIVKQYGSENSVACSGDDFFTDEFGNYNFDSSKLHEAHSFAQTKARVACKESKIVIADNTNVKYWEIKQYLNIAREFNYIVLLIEPRTPHKFDVEKLFLLNKHNVPKEKIAQKLHDYQIIYPFYFAWFLNESDSHLLINLAKESISDCLANILDFKNDLNSLRSTINLNELYHYKNTGMLHCTSKFIGKDKKENFVKNYLSNPIVAQNLGKAFNLEITGFSISCTSVAAVVSLSKEAKSLWGNDLNKEELEEILRDKYFIGQNPDSLMNYLESSDRAHITIGVQQNKKSKKAGLDQINLMLRMKMNKKPTNIETEKFQLFYLNDSFCYTKLKEPLILKSLFTGDY